MAAGQATTFKYATITGGGTAAERPFGEVGTPEDTVARVVVGAGYFRKTRWATPKPNSTKPTFPVADFRFDVEPFKQGDANKPRTDH